MALKLRTITELRVETYESVGLMLVPRFKEVGLVKWVQASKRVRSLRVVGGDCWDVSVGKVLLGRFEGGNSGRVTTSLMSRMAPTVCWVSRDIGLPF